MHPRSRLEPYFLSWLFDDQRRTTDRFVSSLSDPDWPVSEESGDGVMSTSMRDAESLSMSALSLVLIGPHDERRRAIVKALAGPQARIARELTRYPALDDLPAVVEPDHDVVIIDIDPNPERALDVVENICGRNSAVTVMIYSAHADSELLVRCMRAGAREFLT